MACKEWNDEWIAELYGELEAAEAQRLRRHLEECVECGTTLASLATSRELLSGAAPQIPSAPRVVCIEPRSGFSPAWAFAAGLACATIAFAIGMAAAPRVSTPIEAEAKPVVVEQSFLDARLERMEQRVAELEESSHSVPSEVDRALNAAGKPGNQNTLDAFDIENRLTGLERRISVDRARDLDYLLSEINATERRAGNWIGETREALRLVALQNDPRVSHQ